MATIAADLPRRAPDELARRRSFDEEAVRHLSALRSFALRLTHGREDAEDLVSETMLRALQRWEQFHAGTNLRAWLFTILYHAFVSRGRRGESRELQPLEDEEGRALREPVGEADPERAFYDSFLDDGIVRALSSLPEDYRRAVVMSDLQGLKYGEVAAALGVPDGTMKSRLFRGRRLLQARLRDYALLMGYIKPARASAAPSPDSRTFAYRTSAASANA